VTPRRDIAAVATRDRASLAGHDVTLLDLLDRLLAGGIAIHGDITLAVADIDLVDLSLSLVVGSTATLQRGRPPIEARAGTDVG
jgi:hypothetical protein